MTDTTNIAAGLELAKSMVEEAKIRFEESAEYYVSTVLLQDSGAADDYTAAVAAVTGAAAEIQRLQAERDALAERQLVLGGEASALLWAAKQIAKSVGLGPDASLNGIVAAVKSLAARLADAEASDKESLRMYRQALDRADALTAHLAEIRRLQVERDSPDRRFFKLAPSSPCLRAELVSRLEGMQQNGDTWLTVQAVLALIARVYGDSAETSRAAELQRLQAERDALAAKLAEATIDGARAMREHAAQVAWESAHTDECAGDVMQEILNIPLPSAADQARKPLTDDQITEEFERMLGPLKDSRDEGTYLSALAWFRRGAKLARSCDN